MAFTADYFDGVSARARPVSVRVSGDVLSFDAGGETLTYKLADIEVQAKLGSAKRLIDLPGGGRLEAADISELEAATSSKVGAFWRLLHYLENHLGWVMVSLVATVFAGWGFLQYGVPMLAEHVADATSPRIEAKLGEQVMVGLDVKYGYFQPSKIEKSRQAEIVKALADMCTKFNNCPQYRLEFRESQAIGANAFALPGGIVVITDDLIKLAKNDTEIVAVLSHELGHVKKRHAFRQSIQGVLSGLVLAAITGDFSSLASGLPAVIMQMRYTRALETEADAFALNAMQKTCLSPKAFADILMRLSMQKPHKAGKKQDKKDTEKKPEAKSEPKKGEEKSSDDDIGDLPINDMLSSHPDTLERVKPFITAKTACDQ